jgi:hypothetical protein
MLRSALHLLGAVAVTAAGYMGTTVFAILCSVAIAVLPLFVAFYQNGIAGMKTHWKANATWSFGSVVLLWFGLFVWATISQIYADHVAAWTLINGSEGRPGLPTQITALTSQVEDYKSQLAKALADAKDAQSKFEVLTAARAPIAPQEERDPDGIYQSGRIVGQFIGERVDDANGQIPFQTLRSDGHFNSSEDAEFRNLVIHCDNVAGGPPPGVIVGTYMGMTSGGMCRIIGARPTP